MTLTGPVSTEWLKQVTLTAQSRSLTTEVPSLTVFFSKCSQQPGWRHREGTRVPPGLGFAGEFAEERLR